MSAKSLSPLHSEPIYPPRGSVLLPEQDRTRLRAIVEAYGEREACEMLGVPVGTLARALAGLSIRVATGELLRQRLLDAERR